MQISNYDFDLPEHLIAFKPADKRGDDKLLYLKKESGEIEHHHFTNLINLLPADAVLVFNKSKVLKARLFATNKNGGKIEFLLIKPYKENIWQCMVSKSKRQKVGDEYFFEAGLKATLIEDIGMGVKLIEFNNLSEDYLNKYAHIPLPPYIKREDTLEDEERYQTIYAEKEGSVAAPTAGLHFTSEIMTSLKEAGFDLAFVTLHVGLGTFEPVRTENLADHKMHSEDYSIETDQATIINKAIKDRRPIIAIGTTSLRVLESAFDSDTNQLKIGDNSTNIFIYGDYKFKVITGLFTNFHTPKSTLLALVSTLAGDENIKKAYKEAIAKEYKFFSYGDCMLIL